MYNTSWLVLLHRVEYDEVLMAAIVGDFQLTKGDRLRHPVRTRLLAVWVLVSVIVCKFLLLISFFSQLVKNFE